MDANIILTIQITMDENESALLYHALNDNIDAFKTTDEARIVQTYLNVIQSVAQHGVLRDGSIPVNAPKAKRTGNY